MQPKFFDIHTHVPFAAYENDREAVLSHARDTGVWMINVGTQKDTSRKAAELAGTFSEGVYATVGLHPIHTSKSFHDKQELGPEGKEFSSRGEVFDAEYYRALAEKEKVVAIGECGLDYYRLSDDTKAKQIAAFEAQIALANELNLPLMLHIRNAYKDAYDILKREARVPANVHFFAGTWEEAKWFLDLGFTVSFTGVITFARTYDETIKNAPLSHILSETDAPYVAPEPHRGRRNEPAYVEAIVETIAKIRGESYESVRGALLANARRMFRV